MKKVYVAAPFFTPEQLDVVMKVEEILNATRLQYYSPRKDGVLQDMTPEQQKDAMKRIFTLNCQHMESCDFLLAIMNWKDAGVVWELGFFYRKKLFGLHSAKILTFTSNQEKVNVMLKECADGHVQNFDQLSRVLNDYAHNRVLMIDNDGRDVF